MLRYFIIHKPYLVLSQFTREDDKLCLKDFFKVPPSVYPVGRLDYDSEGLLILTNDKVLNKLILQPLQHQKKQYWVQVEGLVTPEAILQLQQGVSINIDGKMYKTLTSEISILNNTQIAIIPARNPPIRERKNIPTTWMSITITEGKNRQVRKMTAAVGLPTLRLIRFSIGIITLQNLVSGKMIELSKKSIYDKLGIST